MEKKLVCMVLAFVLIVCACIVVIGCVVNRKPIETNMFTVIDKAKDSELGVQYVPALSSVYFGGIRRTSSHDYFVKIADEEGNEYVIETGAYLYNTWEIGDEVEGYFNSEGKFKYSGYNAMSVVG